MRIESQTKRPPVSAYLARAYCYRSVCHKGSLVYLQESFLGICLGKNHTTSYIYWALSLDVENHELSHRVYVGYFHSFHHLTHHISFPTIKLFLSLLSMVCDHYTFALFCVPAIRICTTYDVTRTQCFGTQPLESRKFKGQLQRFGCTHSSPDFRIVSNTLQIS